MPDESLEALERAVESALRQRRLGCAVRLLDELAQKRPNSPGIHFQVGVIRRQLGELPQAIAAFDRALTLDPCHLLALLSKAAVTEQLGATRQASRMYADALALVRSPHGLPEYLRNHVEHARQQVTRDLDGLKRHVHAETAFLRASCSAAGLARFDSSIDQLCSLDRVGCCGAQLFHYCGLPANEFFDASLFPWLAELEAATPVLRETLMEVLQATEDRSRLRPYIAYRPGEPVNQWRELNHSPKWSAYFFWRNGQRENLSSPIDARASSAIESIPLAEIPDLAPTVNFSLLQPHTHIPSHTGSTNARVIVHLALYVKGLSRLRVGRQTRTWTEGTAWVFDDTVEHEAWNDSDDMRAILMADVWNPFLEPGERELVSQALRSRLKYYHAENPSSESGPN